MKKELLTEIKRFNEIINYDPKVGTINEVLEKKDLTGWLCIGEIDRCSIFYQQEEDKIYILVDPNYDEETSLKSESIRYCDKKDGTGPQTGLMPQYYLNGSGFKIYPEYRNTKYGEIFLGKQKDPELIQKIHHLDDN